MIAVILLTLAFSGLICSILFVHHTQRTDDTAAIAARGLRELR
ncbi:hypothetical protein ACRAWG_37045 [Methylobacterium sp. P31]